MELRELLRNPPNLHATTTGELALWALEDSVLRFIDRTVGSGSKTLETGAGISTILFAIKQSTHICVVPDADQVERIKTYCREHDIPLNGVVFQVGRSEEVLPRLEEHDIDFVLIDGWHAFPSPFIDWYYTARMLRVGGTLLIDDTQLWTGSVLERFLRSEKEWRQVERFPRSAAFTKIASGSENKDWVDQGFVVANSPMRLEQVRYALGLIRKRQYRVLIKRIERQIRG